LRRYTSFSALGAPFVGLANLGWRSPAMRGKTLAPATMRTINGFAGTGSFSLSLHLT
jgi:hypothetical protein